MTIIREITFVCNRCKKVDKRIDFPGTWDEDSIYPLYGWKENVEYTHVGIGTSFNTTFDTVCPECFALLEKNNFVDKIE